MSQNVQIGRLEEDEKGKLKYLSAIRGAATEPFADALWRAQAAFSALSLPRVDSVRAGFGLSGGGCDIIDQPNQSLPGAISSWQNQLDSLRNQLDSLSSLCAVDYADKSTVITLRGGENVAAALNSSAARCRESVVVAGPLSPPVIAVLPNHVRPRVLFPHLSRYDAEVKNHAERVIAMGGQVRTAATAIPSLVVFDRTDAFLIESGDSDHLVEAHRVNHAPIVAFIAHVAESIWAKGEPFQEAGGSNRLSENLTGEMKDLIVQLLAAGYKDEVVAKRLDIAVRTCRKYIAEIFDDLGARSRFQAGWLMRDRIYAANQAIGATYAGESA